MTAARRSGSYQFWLVLLLSLNFGVVFFDRNAIGFLAPSIDTFKLSNTQLGWLSSALSLTWAISGFAVGQLSERLNSRKPIIIFATIAFCLCSMLGGLATSFLMLLYTRILMGLAEGGIMPVSHAIIVAEVDPEKRGLAMGVGQNLGSNLLGSTLAPLILIPIAQVYGWQSGLFLAAIPGLITAALIWRFVDEPPPDRFVAEGEAKATLGDALANSNVRLCMMISILLVSYLVCCWTFMPKYLIEDRKFDPDTAKWLMATLGISAAIGSFVVSAWSDRIGRKPVIIGFSFLGVILPLAAMYYAGSSWVLAAIFFFGWGLNSVFPIFMATIPSESVDPRLTASLSGIVVAAGEVIGGVLSPILGGMLADWSDRNAIMWLMIILCCTSGLVAMRLRETAPRVIARAGIS